MSPGVMTFLDANFFVLALPCLLLALGLLFSFLRDHGDKANRTFSNVLRVVSYVAAPVIFGWNYYFLFHSGNWMVM